jgi:hypothetical protein
MDTAIEYLNEVHGDLLAAAVRERAGRRRPPSRGRWPQVLAAAAAFVVVAGVIGAIVRSGGLGSDEADTVAAGGAGVTGATGATGGGDQLAGIPAVPAPVEEHAADLGDDADAGPAVDLPRGQTIDTRIVRTAELELTIPRDAFDERFSDVTDIAEANDGFVADSTARARSGSVTLRVPSARFAETLRELRALGEVEVQSVRGQDVTAEYVDLNARLRIAKARRAVLLGLMETAVSIEQTIRVQNALDDTQLRIEELQGSLRLLDDRTSLATVRLSMREEGVERQQEVEEADLANAFERSVAGFVGVIAAIVIGLGYLLPLAILGLIGWFVVTRIQRRREGA